MRSRVSLALAVASLVAAGSALGDTHPGGSSVTIMDPPQVPSGLVAAANPYPSTLQVSGETGAMSHLELTLTGLTHGFPDDVDVMLVAPGGNSILVMSDAGGNAAASALDLSFDDSALASLPDSTALSSGLYKPTNNPPEPFAPLQCPDETNDLMPAPAPSAPTNTTLDGLLGGAHNGTWSLYIVDDCGGDAGQIGGWSLNFHDGSGLTAVGVHDFRALPRYRSVVLRWRAPSAAGIVGFNVYRTAPAVPRVRLNRALVPARLGTAGADGYSFVDRSVGAGSYTYRLQVVRANGARAWAGTAAARVSR